MSPLTAARQRRLERAMHLLAGLILLTYVYVPARRELGDIIRFSVAPLLALTGMARWQTRRRRRALKAARGRHRPDFRLGHLPVTADPAPAFAETRPRPERRR